MARKKEADSVYKLVDMAADSGIRISDSLPGFSVSTQMPEGDFHHKFRNYFRSDFLAVLLVMEGEITLSVNLRQFTARMNNLIIVSPNTIKQLIDLPPSCKMIGVSFTTDFLSKIGLPPKMPEIADYYSSQFYPLWELQPEDAAVIHEMVFQLEQRMLEYDLLFGKELFQHTFNLFMYQMARFSSKYAQEVTGQLPRKEYLLIQFIALVQRQFKTQRSVKEYAAQLNITPKYLTETVKEISGKTAGEIIDDFVMLEARLLLDNPDYSISRIADILNFANQSFFGKFFKRFTGLSPKEYRKSI